MSQFKELLLQSYQPVLSYVSEGDKPQPDIPVEIMDPGTYKLLQMDDLYDAVNFTRTRTGALTLRRSLTQPLTSERLIRAKQDSLRELRENPELKGQFVDFVDGVKETEEGLYNYYRNNFHPGGLLAGISFSSNDKPEQYSVFRDTRKLLTHLGLASRNLSAQTEYLSTLLETLVDFRQSDTFEWVEKPIFRTIHGLRPQSQIGPLTPELMFKPRDLKFLRYAIYGLPLLGVTLG